MPTTPTLLTDDRSTRMELHNWLGFSRAASESWLEGDASGAEAELLLARTLQHLITIVALPLFGLTPYAERSLPARRAESPVAWSWRCLMWLLWIEAHLDVLTLVPLKRDCRAAHCPAVGSRKTGEG
jgi:hypothetical protein